MKITEKEIQEVLGYEVESGVYNLGLCNSSIQQTLTFCDDVKFVKEVIINKNITVVLTTAHLCSLFNGRMNLTVIESKDPRYDFYSIMNDVSRKTYVKRKSVISKTAVIHPTAFVSDYNVCIGDFTIIEPNVTILADVEIGKNCIIRAGSVIGAEGFEHKRTSKGILAVYHDGKVIIGNDVHIGALNAISKGFSFRDTVIGDFSRTDNLVHIAHAVHIGQRCFFPASCMIAGSVTIDDDVWIGPNASVSSGIQIESNAYITLGSVVTRDVKQGEKVTGNFAIPHTKFLENLKKSAE